MSKQPHTGKDSFRGFIHCSKAVEFPFCGREQREGKSAWSAAPLLLFLRRPAYALVLPTIRVTPLPQLILCKCPERPPGQALC